MSSPGLLIGIKPVAAFGAKAPRTLDDNPASGAGGRGSGIGDRSKHGPRGLPGVHPSGAAFLAHEFDRFGSQFRPQRAEVGVVKFASFKIVVEIANRLVEALPLKSEF